MKKKGLIAIFSVCITLIVALVATIVVLASGTQGVGTNVSVLYVATDIEGEVSATYSRVNKNTKAVYQTTDMVTSSGAKKVSFFASQPTTTSLLNPTESNIALTAEQDLIITYTFSGVAEYYAALEYVDKDQAEPNIEFEYALNDGEYSKGLSMPIKVEADKSTTFSIKLHIANTARSANLSGSLNWVLTKDAPVTPIEGANVTVNLVNHDEATFSKNTIAIQTNSDGKRFKIIAPTPVLENPSVSFINGMYNERTLTASGKVSSVEDLMNDNGAEFFYFCTNSAVVGSLSYNNPGAIYYASTSDNTLENWYDIPAEKTNLYSCFMTPNYTKEEAYSGDDTQIIVSNKVKNIPSRAFLNKKTITDVVFSQCVENIGYGTTSVSNGAFMGCSNLVNVYMSNSITHIGKSAFSTCSALTKVALSNNLTEIGAYAFNTCTSLKDIVIPDSVNSIGDFAFNRCSALPSINIPEQVTSVNTFSFWWCTSLTSVTISNGVESIAPKAFGWCTSLENIVLPDSVTSIGDNAFFYCERLLGITIPKKVKSIGDSAFDYCCSLGSIEVASENSTYYSADNCLIEKESKTLILGCKNSVIPYGVVSIGKKAFSTSIRLASIIIPDSVTSIGEKAFFACYDLTSIIIPASVNTIGVGAFDSCDNELKNVTFADSESTWTVNSEIISVDNPSLNATNLTTTYRSYAWTKNA